MEYGWSVVLNDYVHATELDYNDCEKFVILCPACKEAVFKRGSEITTRQYLSHYPLKGQLNCELRVEQIVRERLGAPRIIVPHGQELERFLRHYKELVYEHLGAYGENMRPMITSMRARHAYRRFIYHNRAGLRGSLLEYDDNEPEFVPYVERLNEMSRTRASAFGSNVQDRFANPDVFTDDQLAAIRTVCEFLCAPNSFSALVFSISYGLLMAYSTVRWPQDFIPLQHRNETTFEKRGLEHYSWIVGVSDRQFNIDWRAFPAEKKLMYGADLVSSTIQCAAFFVKSVSENWKEVYKT